jgi:hypothetical protein
MSTLQGFGLISLLTAVTVMMGLIVKKNGEHIAATYCSVGYKSVPAAILIHHHLLTDRQIVKTLGMKSLTGVTIARKKVVQASGSS